MPGGVPSDVPSGVTAIGTEVEMEEAVTPFGLVVAIGVGNIGEVLEAAGIGFTEVAAELGSLGLAGGEGQLPVDYLGSIVIVGLLLDSSILWLELVLMGGLSNMANFTGRVKMEEEGVCLRQAGS